MMSEKEESNLPNRISTNSYQQGNSVGGNGGKAAYIAVSPGGGKNSKKGTSDAENRLNAALNEVQIRFVMNLPPSELASVDRLFFQLEQAWWWYEDFMADEDDSLPHFSQQKFTRKLFQHCPLLRPLHGQYDALQKKFRTWKAKIPVVGCILLTHSRKNVILVRNWKGDGRTFPRGKINEGESNKDAAIREVQEETGFNPEPFMKNCPNIELEINGQKTTMFIVPDVPGDFPFSPQVRKEISEVWWFPIDGIPKGTYGVLPFISRLKKWILKEQGKKRMTATSVSAAKAQQAKEGREKVPNAAAALHSSSTSSSKSSSKRKEKFVEDKVTPPTSNNLSSHVSQQKKTADNRKLYTERINVGPERGELMASIDQGGRNARSSLGYNIEGGGFRPIVQSLHEVEGEVTTPNCSGELFGKFKFDMADILAAMDR